MVTLTILRGCGRDSQGFKFWKWMVVFWREEVANINALKSAIFDLVRVSWLACAYRGGSRCFLENALPPKKWEKPNSAFLIFWRKLSAGYGETDPPKMPLKRVIFGSNEFLKFIFKIWVIFGWNGRECRLSFRGSAEFYFRGFKIIIRPALNFLIYFLRGFLASKWGYFWKWSKMDKNEGHFQIRKNEGFTLIFCGIFNLFLRRCRRLRTPGGRGSKGTWDLAPERVVVSTIYRWVKFRDQGGWWPWRDKPGRLADLRVVFFEIFATREYFEYGLHVRANQKLVFWSYFDLGEVVPKFLPLEGKICGRNMACPAIFRKSF